VPLLLIRHADAVPENPELPDHDRHLSAGGRWVAARIGQSLVAAGVRLEAVASSPLVRAVQTAELLSAAAGYAGVVEVLPDLAPGGDLLALAGEAARRTDTVALVGHEPGLSSLAAVLCNRASFRMLQKGEIVAIDQGKPAWALAPGDRAPRSRE
jgi:phosphohistidine phosphatase